MHELTTEQRTTYLRELLQRYGTLSLPLGSGLSFSLIQVFQPLRLRQSIVDVQAQRSDSEEETRDISTDAEEDDEAEKQAATQEVLAENGAEALKQSPRGRLVILGGPGTGKTAVLKHLLYSHAQLALEDERAPLPIFLSLPDLARSGQDLTAYLAQMAKDLGLDANNEQTLASAIQHGRAFVCLDSLDEVLPRLRAGIIRQINQLAQESGNSWIVGSRFTDYKGGQFQQGQFQEWELQTLDEMHRLQLAEQLLPEIQRQLATRVAETASLDPEAYVQALGAHRQAATWSENPLLFSLGAVVYLRRGTLAGSRALLYCEVIDALLETRQPDLQQRANLRAILSEVALHLYQIKGRTFSADDLRAALTTLNSEQQATWTIEEMLYRVLNAGVLDTIAYETYSFRHQTFQEYLVASALARRFMSEDEHIRVAGQDFAWSKHTYSRWNEIERLLVGILVQEHGEAGIQQARAWLERLLRQQESAEGDPGHLNLELAIRLLGEVAELDEWQEAETLELEEAAATTWVGWIKQSSTTANRERKALEQRPLQLAPEIGRLRPSAQDKAITPLLAALQQRLSYAGKMLGSLHSRAVADRLRSAWQADPDNWYQWSRAFVFLQEYAPTDLLLPLLETASEESTHNPIHILINLGKYAPLPELLALLSHTRLETRRMVATTLNEIASKAPIPTDPLVALCQQAGIGSFEAACVLARQHHPAALEPLLVGLHAEDLGMRKGALLALAGLGTLVPLQELLPCLDEADPEIRQRALETLSSWGQDAPLERLITMLKDPDAGVRRSAVEALKHLKSSHVPISSLYWLEALHDTNTEVVVTAIKALGTLGKHAPIEPLLALLNHPESWVATKALVALASPALVERVPIEPLLAFYAQNWRQRAEAIFTLSKMGHRLPRLFLFKALNDNQVSQKEVARMLGQEASHFSSEELIAEIGNNAWSLRCAAVTILALHGAEQELPLLLAALRDDAPRVSETAMQSMQQIADLVPLENLLDACQHPTPWVRSNALNILAKRSEYSQPEPLIAALSDSHASVRAAAARAFFTWTDNAPLEKLIKATLDEHEEVRLAAARTLGNVGLRNPALALEGLFNVLYHPALDEDNSNSIMRSAFTSIAPQAPTEPLLRAMYDLHTEQLLWKASIVAHALATQGQRIPVAPLREMLSHPDADMRYLALIALGGAGGAAPIPEIITFLDAPQQHVRNTAIQALNSLYEYVPDEIFLRIWQQEVPKNAFAYYTLKALKNKGRRIPADMLAEIVHIPRFFIHTMVAFLCTLDELHQLPTDVLIALLAMMRTHFRPDARIPSHLEEIYHALVPGLPLSALLEVLKSPDVRIRQGVLMLCAYHPGEVPQETLLAALVDPAHQVRQEALKRLRAHSLPLPVQPVLRCLHDTKIQVLQEAILTLSTMGNAAPIDDLLPLLNDPNESIRTSTLTALSRPGLIKRIPEEIFLSMTGDAASLVRQMAIKALKRKDQQHAITCSLVELSSSVSHSSATGTYQIAFKLLQELAPALIPEIVQEARMLLQGGKPERFLCSLSMSFTAETIGNMGRPIPELLVYLGELLNWPHWGVRVKAIQALGKLRRNIPDTTIRRLLELRHDPHSRTVREVADEALAEILSLETGIEDG